MVRKDCYDQRAWDTGGINAYASSSIDSWLNGDYKALLGVKVQSAIGTTTFKYTPGNNNETVGNLSRPIFLLSMTELGNDEGYTNVEGSLLPIAATLKNSVSVDQWTRTPTLNYTALACLVWANGVSKYTSCEDSNGARPCFTLPSTTKINDNGQVIE